MGDRNLNAQITNTKPIGIPNVLKLAFKWFHFGMVGTITIIVIQVNRSKHSINETQVMEQRIFSIGIKEQLMLQNVNDVNKRAHLL